MADPNKHAILSPSGASGWMNCAGWRGGTGSAYAAEGTAAHELASWCLSLDTDAAAYIGRIIEVASDEHAPEGYKFTVDEDMAGFVQSYVDTVRQVRDATGGQMLVEQRLPIGHITGEDGAEGTADAVILAGNEIIVIDLKFGRGVQVDADENEQMQMYALGAVEQYSMLGDFTDVRMMIVQPRISHVSEWSCSIDQLKAFGERASAAALKALPTELTGSSSERNPGEKQCRWCANKPCAAQTEHVISVVTGAPREDVATLEEFTAVGAAVERSTVWVKSSEAEIVAGLLPHLDLIEDFCKAVRARGEELLHAGTPVPGYKLVRGRKGNRTWADAAAAEAAMKAMRLKQEVMYDFKLISPTSAEELAKAEVIGKRQWPKLQALITQSEGGLTVAPASDKRPAVEAKPAADEFTDLTAAPAEEAALDLI